MIGEYPSEEWHGGESAAIISGTRILSERGQVSEIDEDFSPSEGEFLLRHSGRNSGSSDGGFRRTEAGQTGIIFPTGSFREMRPQSRRQRENCRRACAIWNDITTGRLRDHTLLCRRRCRTGSMPGRDALARESADFFSFISSLSCLGSFPANTMTNSPLGSVSSK